MRNIRLFQCLLRLVAQTGGASTVEFGLLAATLFLPLTIGLHDFGTTLYRQMEVGAAARAGAAAASTCGCFSSVNITSAIQAATRLGTSVSASPSPTQFCGCPSASGGVTATTNTAPACGSTECAAGGFDAVYVSINAQYVYTPFFSGYGPFTLTSQATVRIK
jgi:Flp pilus assembly protein TadG